MSVCISQHGEYGSHTVDTEYTCTRCGVLDEEALTAELRRLRQELDEARAERDHLDGQIKNLADAIMAIPGEPSSEGGAVDVALRMIGEWDRMRPVVEAAEAWARRGGGGQSRDSWQPTDAEDALEAAIDAYRSSTSDAEPAPELHQGRDMITLEGRAAERAAEILQRRGKATLLSGNQSVGDRSPESYCHRCGGPNISWSAPSPLWNAVMRGGSINGPMEFDEIICPLCFAALAIERGVAGAHWRFFANDVQAELELVTPTGRVWSSTTWLWETSGEEARRGRPVDVLGHAPVQLVRAPQG